MDQRTQHAIETAQTEETRARRFAPGHGGAGRLALVAAWWGKRHLLSLLGGEPAQVAARRYLLAT